MHERIREFSVWWKREEENSRWWLNVYSQIAEEQQRVRNGDEVTGRGAAVHPSLSFSKRSPWSKNREAGFYLELLEAGTLNDSVKLLETPSEECLQPNVSSVFFISNRKRLQQQKPKEPRTSLTLFFREILIFLCTLISKSHKKVQIFLPFRQNW